MNFSKVKKIILNPLVGIPIFVLFFLIFPTFLIVFYELSLKEFLILLVGILLFLEVFFNFVFRLINGHKYKSPKKVPFKDLHIEPHPYIPYIYKRNFKSPPAEETRYPLHRGEFSTCDLRTNNFKFFNGPGGNRDIVVPKPKDLFRITCIGASTTQNYISFNNKNYSYPMELENILKKKLKKNLEVNNCGQGGYTSADILIRFLLQIVDTEPDALIIYHGHADVKSYLTPNFESDYSHSRQNLSENYWKLNLGSKIPKTPLNFLNYLTSHWFPYNTRLSLNELVHKKSINEKTNYFPGLKSYERNLQHIIDVCKSNKIEVILSTYCHFLYDEVKNVSIHKLYGEIIAEENKIMKKLSVKNSLKLIDNASLIPKEKKYFVDTVHFTHEGMSMLASNISEAF